MEIKDSDMIFWQLQFQLLMVRYWIINNCHQIPELVTQPRLAVMITHTIIAVLVHCYLVFNGLICWFTRIVNIVKNTYIIWVFKTLSKYNIFSDAGQWVDNHTKWIGETWKKASKRKSHRKTTDQYIIQTDPF